MKYLFFPLVILFFSIRYRDISDKDCISVPPGGISGFWYSISKIKELDKKEYFCASSGCLVVVSNQLDLKTVYNIAKFSRDNFNSIGDIKNNFIDSIVKRIKNIPNVSIVTMNKFGTCIERKPLDKKQLKTLLIKTTDIPFLIKNTFGEIDGGICYHYMNQCKSKIILPHNRKFLLNLFNPYISQEDLRYFYNYR
tara:strand:- start:910 stop:1494 length:585 start_codon:yes stop_codon:yes gene_type:complete